MCPDDTALVLVGFQNDYFHPEGVLHSVIEDSIRKSGFLQNLLSLIDGLSPTPTLLVSTPIVFTPDYRELVEPVGILKAIRDLGAFSSDSKGSNTISEIEAFGDRIVSVPGKRGLNAFSNTALDRVLKQNGVTNLVLAGVVTSLCIDSTARSAHERGYRVSILSDCTGGRTEVEQEFYCSEIFPFYAEVITHKNLMERLAHGSG